MVAYELRRQRRDGEGVAAEALDLEADGAQLVEMRLQHGRLRRAALVQDRRDQPLRGPGGGLDALPVTIVEDTAFRDMLVDEAQSARHGDDDLAHPVMPDD